MWYVITGFMHRKNQRSGAFSRPLHQVERMLPDDLLSALRPAPACVCLRVSEHTCRAGGVGLDHAAEFCDGLLH